MVAYVTAGKGKPERRQLRGVGVWVVPMSMTGIWGAWQRRRQWRTLHRMGVRYAVFPLALAQEAERWGIRKVAVYPLRRAVWEQMLPRCGSTAVLRAGYVDADVRRSAAVLAQHFRYLRLETGWGTEELARELLRRYGLGAGGCGEAETTVSFGGEPTAAGEICLGEDCERWQKAEYEEVAGLEESDIPEELLCVLFQSGGVKKEEIRVKRLLSNA